MGGFVYFVVNDQNCDMSSEMNDVRFHEFINQ